MTDDEPAAAPSVLWKAFGVLAAFSHQDRVLTLAEIARRSGLPKSTAHRVLAILAETGAVEQGEGGYRTLLEGSRLASREPSGR
jgi:DNA-binding IclR family transcriptional regulator